MHWAVERLAQDYCKTTEVKEHPSLTRAVLQTVNILLHWLSVDLATVQASKGVRKGGLGLTPFSLICYKNFNTCANEINCFHILFAC